MAYTFRPQHRLGSEVTRVIQRQIEEAIEATLDVRVAQQERVRTARTTTKRVRAVLRLVRGAAPAIHRKENAWFRDTARQLSPLRDADVLLGTLTRLLQHFRGEIDRGGMRAVRQVLLAHRRECVPEPEEVERRLTRCAERFREAAERLQDWKIKQGGFALIAACFGQDYGRARKAGRLAREQGGATAFHEWRKRVKVHAYQLRLLRAAWPEVLKPWRAEVKALADLLGEEHDLTVLREFLQGAAVETAGLEPVQTTLALIAVRRDELRAQAILAGERVFAEKPGAAVGRLRGWWEAAAAAGGRDQARASRQ